MHASPDPVSQKDLDEGTINGHLTAPDRESRQEAAIALRLEGATYSEIAETLGYASAALARQAVERGLASLAGPEDREQLRFLEARRLERILRGLWGKATDPKNEEHLPAARTALSVIDRHARLYGLDAPQEMVIYNPTNTELEGWVRTITKQVRSSGPEEVDIISGEVIHEEDIGVGDDE